MSLSEFYIDHGLDPGDDVCSVLHSFNQSDLDSMAKRRGWKKLTGKRTTDYTRHGFRLSFNTLSGTVSAYLGKKQLHGNRDISLQEASDWFENPRRPAGLGRGTIPQQEMSRKRGREDDDDDGRVCASCQEEKRLSFFSKNQLRKGSLGRCLDCVASN